MRLSFSGPSAGWAVAVVLVGSLAASGCGGGTGTVSGKVLHKGAPLKGGVVTFVHTGGGTSGTSSIAEDGSHKIVGISPGKVKICVETETLNPARKARTPAYSPPPGMQGPVGLNQPGQSDSADQAKRYTKINSAYATPETTTLAYEVKSGNQTYDIPAD